MHTFTRFVWEDTGEDLIEYGLLAAFVAACGIAVLYTLGLENAITAAYKKAINLLNQ